MKFIQLEASDNNTDCSGMILIDINTIHFINKSIAGTAIYFKEKLPIKYVFVKNSVEEIRKKLNNDNMVIN